ncbi:MAG: DUF6503 family protein [Bacteroidota bacterium]
MNYSPYYHLPFLLFFSFSFIFSVNAQDLSGSVLLEKSIQYHDPEGNWENFKEALHFTETRPNGKDRQTTIHLDNRKNNFHLDQIREGQRIERIVENGKCTHRVNGSEMISADWQEKFRLNCDRSISMKNYYTYLWGMPMKLKDPGTIIDPNITTTEFLGQSVLSMKVTYEPEVGKDIWYFYFHPTTYALVGYRFYHDESANDGEYIPLKEEISIQGIRFPKVRTWYVNKDDRLLGSDILEGSGKKK